MRHRNEIGRKRKVSQNIETKLTIVQIPRRFSWKEWGGTESVILHTSKELNRQGYAVKILTSDLLASASREVHGGIEIRRVHGFYPRWGLSKSSKQQLDVRGGNYFCLKLFWAVLFTRNLYAVHLHTGGFMGTLGRWAAYLRRKPCVVSIHGGQLDLPKEQLDQLLAPLKGTINWGKGLEILLQTHRLNANVDALICLARTEQLKLQEKYPTTRVVTLPNGVDISRFASGDGEAFRRKFNLEQSRILLAVGGFYEQKNQMTLLKAFARLKAGELHDAKLVMIGVVYDQDYYAALHRYVESSHLEQDVVFIANLNFDSEDLPNAYKAADCFVHPSRYETFGIVILEAFAASCPVVCGAVGGIRDYGENEGNLLFADIDAEESIAAAILRIFNDVPLASRLQEEGRKTAGKYSWASVTDKLLEFYR